MKKVSGIIIFLLMMHVSFSQQIKKVKIGDVLKMIDTSSSPLVINFWASWCKPCVHEIPWFEKNIIPLESKGVKLILVSLDLKEDYPKAIAEFAKKENYQSLSL